MSTIQPEQLAKEVERILQDFIGVTEDAASMGVIDTANDVVSELHNAHPPGSGKYGSWDAYNADWDRQKVSASGKGVYSVTVYNKKHYQLAHLLEKGHALKGGGRTRAFPHIAPVAEKAQDMLLQNIRKNINNA